MIAETWNQVVAEGEARNDPHTVTLRWKAYEHRLEFVAREATPQPDGRVIFYREDDAGRIVPHDDFDTADNFLSGTVKWDGCCDWTFGRRGDDGYIHLCGELHMASLQWVFAEAWKLAAQHVPAFDQ